jgi:hypothetical protein
VVGERNERSRKANAQGRGGGGRAEQAELETEAVRAVSRLLVARRGGCSAKYVVLAKPSLD